MVVEKVRTYFFITDELIKTEHSQETSKVEDNARMHSMIVHKHGWDTLINYMEPIKICQIAELFWADDKCYIE